MLLLIHSQHQWHKSNKNWKKEEKRKIYQQQWHLHHRARLNKLLRTENVSWKFIATQVSLPPPWYLINISYRNDNQFSTQQRIFFFAWRKVINSNEVNKWFWRGKFQCSLLLYSIILLRLQNIAHRTHHHHYTPLAHDLFNFF